MYYIKGANKVYGCSEEMLHTLLEKKRITLEVLVSTDQKTWQPLKTFPGFSSSDSSQNTSSASHSSSTASTQSSAMVKASNGSSNTLPAVSSDAAKSGGNSSGGTSFDFLKNNNSSSSSDNTNNSYSQQYSTTPTPSQSVPAQQSVVPSIPVPEEKWFLSNDGVNGFGPYPTSQVVSMIQNGQVIPSNLAWRNGENAVQISNIPAFANYFHVGSAPVNFNASMPNYNAPMQPMPNTGYVYQVPPHSRVTYVLLGLFFGCLGVHNFYAGYSGRGAFQLISVLFCFGWVFVPIWVLIEICTVTSDANGVPFV